MGVQLLRVQQRQRRRSTTQQLRCHPIRRGPLCPTSPQLLYSPSRICLAIPNRNILSMASWKISSRNYRGSKGSLLLPAILVSNGKASRPISAKLGATSALEGSVRRDGERIRVSAQLIDAESGVHLWAEKYDHAYTDIFALQDTITESVVGTIEPEILVSEGRRAVRNNPANLDAFDCCMRGIWHFHQLGAQDNRQVEIWIRRSIDLDPKLARAHAMLARVLAVRCWAGYSDDIERDVQVGQAAAERAVTLEDRDPGSHCALAVLSLITRQHERALTAAERAIELNPNFTLGYFALGEIRLFAGKFSEMLDPMARCLRLSPRDPLVSFRVSLIALAHYHLGNYQEAVRYSERALRKSPMYVAMRTLAAALGQLGRTEEARAALSEMERIKPTNAKGYWEFTNPYADPVHEAKLLEGLYKAGMLQN